MAHEGSKETTLIGFADDLAVAVIAKPSKDVELYGNETIHVIKAWLQIVKPDQADEKMEEVPITNCWKKNNVKIRVGNHQVILKSITRYLG